MNKFRWWLFKKLSQLGWWVCPEPHKSRLQSHMPTWSELPDDFVFASRHNDETGECEPIDLDPPMVRKLHDRLASKSAEDTKAKIRDAFSGLQIPARIKSDAERRKP